MAYSRFLLQAVLLSTSAACATAPLARSGSLISYDNLTSSNGVMTQSMLRVTKKEVLAAKAIQLIPTRFSHEAFQANLSEQQRKLITNAIDRSLCVGLSERFLIVGFGEPADLIVQAVVTHLTPTDVFAAGVSKVISIVPAALSLGVPVPVPRLPVGLGSLSVEAEARTQDNHQTAAMIWARGANSISSKPKVSEVADAYDLATAFGEDFSNLLTTGETPFGKAPSMPTLQKLGSDLGASPKNSVCEAFGRNPGLIGMVGGGLGLPPEWTDKGSGERP